MQNNYNHTLILRHIVLIMIMMIMYMKKQKPVTCYFYVLALLIKTCYTNMYGMGIKSKSQLFPSKTTLAFKVNVPTLCPSTHTRMHILNTILLI